MNRRGIKRLSVSAMLFALGLLLPFLTGQVPEIGNMLLPMHFPVLLCGLTCGPLWGLCVGATLPLVRSLIFSRPALFPTAIAMATELATYAFVVGAIYSRSKKSVLSLYASLAVAMIFGRVVWGAVMALLLLGNGGFGIAAFVSGAVLEAIPGIVLQLILIPVIMIALGKTGRTSK